MSQGVDMDNKVLVDDQDNVKDNDAPLHENVPEAGLAVKTQITVFVIHDNMEWSVPVLLNSKMTVQTVKVRKRGRRRLCARGCESLVCLSV